MHFWTFRNLILLCMVLCLNASYEDYTAAKAGNLGSDFDDGNLDDADFDDGDGQDGVGRYGADDVDDDHTDDVAVDNYGGGNDRGNNYGDGNDRDNSYGGGNNRGGTFSRGKDRGATYSRGKDRGNNYGRSNENVGNVEEYQRPKTTASSIPIGIISDMFGEELRAVVEYATSVVNVDLSVPLSSELELIEYGDTLNAQKKLCGLMESGIGAILGPSAQKTSDHLMTICDAKDVPYIRPQLFPMPDDVVAMNLLPPAVDIASAINDIVVQFDWSRFVFLYESSEYLQILDSILSFYDSEGPVISVHRYDLHLNGNYKPVLRQVRKSIDSRIVVVGSTPSVAELLKQAQQVGIMNEDYKYLIANLDFHTFNLEEYKYSEANITALRLFSPDQKIVQNLVKKLNQPGLEEAVDEEEENEGEEGEEVEDEEESAESQDGTCPITVEMALAYDTVILVAEASKQLQYQPQGLNCSARNDNVQPDGSTFLNYMRSSELHDKTITGHMYFHGNVRKGHTFEVIELQQTGIIKVGYWNAAEGFVNQYPPAINIFNDIEEGSLVNKTFVVLISVPNKPYADLVESHKRLEGNNQYEGYGIDLIKELAEKLGFNFTFVNGGNDYGSFNKTTNITTGMLKEIAEGRADLAITDLTITSEREEVIDFSIPFMNLGIAILYIKPQAAPPALFSFMDPFSGDVWFFLGMAYIGIALTFVLLGRLSPTEWDNPYPCIEEPEELENQFTIGNSLWFCTGALLQQGSEIAPKAWSTRTLAGILWFFTLIMVASYTANLAAFLTIENPTSLIDNVNDLAENKNGVQYGAKRTGSTRNFFQTSEEEIYVKMNEYMTLNKEYLTESNQQGVAQVTTGKHYAFLMESTSIQYNTVRDCNLQQIGEPLDEKGYGIAMVKNWPYRDKFNNALLELQEQGVLAELKNKWWNEIGASVCQADGDPVASKLGLDNLGGAYFVLIVGSVFSLFFGITKWFLFVMSKAKFYNVPFRAAFVEEYKLVFDFDQSERMLKSSQSVYSRSRHSSISIGSVDQDGSADEGDDNTKHDETANVSK